MTRRTIAVTLIVLASLTGCRGENAPKSLKGDVQITITEDMSGWKYISYGGGKNCRWKVTTTSVTTRKTAIVSEGGSTKKNQKTFVQLFSSSEGNLFTSSGCAPWFRSDQPVEE